MTEAVPNTAKPTIDLAGVHKIIDRFPDKSRRYLVPVLSHIQHDIRWLPEEVIEVVMTEFDITRAEIYGVISFYPSFRTTEPGKYIFRLCYGTACFVKGAPIIAERLHEKYQMGQAETDPSKLFTLEFASCLGNCSAAPMAIIGEDTHGSIDPDKTLELAEKYSKSLSRRI